MRLAQCTLFGRECALGGSVVERSTRDVCDRLGVLVVCTLNGVFPLGAAVTLDELIGDPHPLLARLRQREPVSWLPVLNGWLVSRYEVAVQVMRDPATFTVDDPRFSTARVVGPSMLSSDGADHAHHRGPFAQVFRPAEVGARFA